MVKIFQLVSVSVALLSILNGCGGGSSSSSNNNGSGTGVVTAALMNGTWVSDCHLDDDEIAMTGLTYVVIIVTINSGTLSGLSNSYANNDTACTGAFTAIPSADISTFTLGENISLDGSVAGVMAATEIDIFNPGFPPDTTFEIVAIKDNKLYLGDLEGSFNGTSDALRSVQLDGVYFYTRQ